MRKARQPAACGFNPRAREGRDFRWPVTTTKTGAFQSTRREGRDVLQRQRLDRNVIVSIHAPARGATRAVHALPAPCLVSIHAPARGATGCL